MRKASHLRHLAGWAVLWLLLCLPAGALAEDPVHFNDPNLEAAVEAALGKVNPTPNNMLALTTLVAWDKGIIDLTGLEYATNLTYLDLCGNQINDLSPLASLVNLTRLYLIEYALADLDDVVTPERWCDLGSLDGLGNQISDLSPLAGLTNLTELAVFANETDGLSPLAGLTNLSLLVLWGNQISDISPLAGLTNLRWLWLFGKQIDDISPVAGLTDLSFFALLDSQVSDISALGGLTHLAELYLGIDGFPPCISNEVSDISPLVSLTHLAILDLSGNPLNGTACEVYIPQITANNPGVQIYHDDCVDQCTLAIACSGSGTVEMQVLSGWVSTTLTGWGTYVLDYGSQVTITVTANNGWRFTGWSGSVCSPERTLGFTLTDDWSLTANFAQYPRTLGVTCGLGGKVVKPGVGAFVYERGTTVPIEATPDRGYAFARWIGTLVDKGYVADPTKSRTQVVLNEDGNVHATFVETARQFHESWETAATGVYPPATGSYFFADEGSWTLGDGVFGSRLCGSAPHNVEVVTLDSGHALIVTSTDTRSQCTDTVWVAIDTSGLVNEGRALVIDANTVISFHEVGRLDAPALHGSGKDCNDPPCFDNASLLVTDNRGNHLAYVLQRPADAVANVPNAYLGGSYREIFLDPSGIRYRRNLFTDFCTIPAFSPSDSDVWTIEFHVAEHGSAIIDDIIIGPGAATGTIPVYHFWSPTLETHFFTIGAEEKQYLIDTWSSVWTFEGISYLTLPAGSSPDLTPVYRFWSPVLSSHFYTSSEEERDYLVRQFPDVWSLEGIAFYVFAQGRQPADACPVYRFWSPTIGCHFYTADPNECDEIARNESDTWTLEGVAWYAYSSDWDSEQALDILAAR